MKITIAIVLFLFFCSPSFGQGKDTSVVMTYEILKNKLKILKKNKRELTRQIKTDTVNQYNRVLLKRSTTEALKKSRREMQAENYSRKIWALAFSSEISMYNVFNDKKYFFEIEDQQNIAYTYLGQYFPGLDFSYRDKYFNDHSIGFSVSQSESIETQTDRYFGRKINSNSKSLYYDYNYLLLKKLKKRYYVLPCVGARVLFNSINQNQEWKGINENFYLNYFIKYSINDIVFQLRPGFKLLNKTLKLELGCNINIASIVWGNYTDHFLDIRHGPTDSETKKISTLASPDSHAIFSSVYIKLGFNFGFKKEK